MHGRAKAPASRDAQVEPMSEPLAGLEGADVELTAITLFLHRAAATLAWPLAAEQRERLLAHVKAALTDATALRARLHKRVNAEPALAPRLAELTREYDVAARAAHQAASALPPGPLLPGGPLHDDWRPPAARAINTAALVARLTAQDFARPTAQTEDCIREFLREQPLDAPLPEDQWRSATEAAWRAHLLAWTLQSTTTRARANVQAHLGTLDPAKIALALAQLRLAAKPDPVSVRRRLTVLRLLLGVVFVMVLMGVFVTWGPFSRGALISLGCLYATVIYVLRRR
jgi:hypothetical protein